jgi:2-amino-4-hydroxy-6-hydroxymethyldihydropteridine diphosphokinase
VTASASSKRAFLSLGSNLDDRVALLAAALDALAESEELVGVSPVYETAPVGGPEGQGAFLNLVVELRTTRSPQELLALAHELEAQAERRREIYHGPRTLDVDLLLFEGYESQDPQLTIPHPRMYERRFVLAPLADVAPELVEASLLEAAVGEVHKIGMLSALR